MEFNKTVFANRLRELMNEYNDTVYSLSEAVHLSPGTISKYLNEKIDPRRSTIESIARHYRVNPVWLMGADVEKYLILDRFMRIPIYRDPTDPETHQGYESVLESKQVDFCIYAADDNMIGSRILKDDLIYIRKQSDIESGGIALVSIDGRAVLKRVYKTNNVYILRSDNPADPDERVLSKRDVKILGKVIMFRSEVG